MQGLTYEDAVHWLKERGGRWSGSTVSDGWEVVADIGGIQGRGLTTSYALTDLRAAVATAVAELREKFCWT